MNKSTFEDQLRINGRIVYTVVGCSMTPLLHEKRDLVVIEPIGSHKCKKNDVILYRINNRYVLHRIVQVRAQDYVMRGDRCIKKEYGITQQHVLGIMTSFVKKGKVKSVKGFLYRLYTFFWCDMFFLRFLILKIGSFFKRSFLRR